MERVPKWEPRDPALRLALRNLEPVISLGTQVPSATPAATHLPAQRGLKMGSRSGLKFMLFCRKTLQSVKGTKHVAGATQQRWGVRDT